MFKHTVLTDLTALKSQMVSLESQMGAIARQLGTVQGLLRRVLKEEGDIMGIATDIKDLVTQIDTATTAVADRIQKLLDLQAQGGLTPQEQADITGALNAELAKLKGLGSDPSNPIPAAATKTITVKGKQV